MPFNDSPMVNNIYALCVIGSVLKKFTDKLKKRWRSRRGKSSVIRAIGAKRKKQKKFLKVTEGTPIPEETVIEAVGI
ncbi:hypothetical protein ACQ86O_16285 [Serratia sp. L9]|uniref:hypothetical protein n=1 Tax=Serratia sp. L9 TaxID=3423946 RepID=UPI003D671C83